MTTRNQAADARLPRSPRKPTHGFKRFWFQALKKNTMSAQLTEQQRVALERLGECAVRNLRNKSLELNPSGPFGELSLPDMTRADVDVWLNEQAGARETREATVAWWTKWGAIAAIVATVFAVIGVFGFEHLRNLHVFFWAVRSSPTICPQD
jgi:hypothetical protein